MMQKIRILSLGDIVSPSMDKAVVAFAQAIAQEKGINLNEALKDIVTVLNTQHAKLIDPFKLGMLDESSFRQQMIAALKEQTGVALSLEAFNTAWNSMNPAFADFQINLEAAAQYNKSSGQSIIFISYTNPIDMHHLIDELNKHHYPYQLDQQGNLATINGIAIKLSYVEKKPKDTLLAETISECRENRRQVSLFAQKGLFEQPTMPNTIDIKLIAGVNKDIMEQTLRKNFEQIANKVAEFAKQSGIEILPWQQKEQSFESLVQNEPQAILIRPSSL